MGLFLQGRGGDYKVKDRKFKVSEGRGEVVVLSSRFGGVWSFPGTTHCDCCLFDATTDTGHFLALGHTCLSVLYQQLPRSQHKYIYLLVCF